MEAASLAEEVQKYPWYHTLDLGNGVVTTGMFDHREMVDNYMLPADLSGKRCLDVGTMDGFWAFEMERRGASEVYAIDVNDPDKLDWPASLRGATVKTIDETKTTRFELAREALNSKVNRQLYSVYELSPDLFGTFDFVFCGDLLVHLKDPPTAVQNIRSVCTGMAVIVNPIREFWFARNRPMAEFDGIDNFEWWCTNLAGLKRLMIAAGFAKVEAGRPFKMPARIAGDWKGLRGVVRATV
jgi:tRNA (mo5U34)-methyltransferase